MGPSRKQTSSASSKVSGDLSSQVGHARSTSSALCMQLRARRLVPGETPWPGTGNGCARTPGPSVCRIHSMTGRAGAARSATGSLQGPERELGDALDAHASRLDPGFVKQRAGGPGLWLDLTDRRDDPMFHVAEEDCRATLGMPVRGNRYRPPALPINGRDQAIHQARSMMVPDDRELPHRGGRDVEHGRSRPGVCIIG